MPGPGSGGGTHSAWAAKGIDNGKNTIVSAATQYFILSILRFTLNRMFAINYLQMVIIDRNILTHPVEKGLTWRPFSMVTIEVFSRVNQY